MITPLPPDLPPHAFGVDDAATSSPNPVPIGGHFNQALLGHSCRAPKCALFAGATVILAKLGVANINSNLATAVRTSVIFVLVWGIALADVPASTLMHVSRRTLAFLVLSGLATGLSWVCYFRALQLGEASRVAPVDKLSVVFVLVFAALFLGEHLTFRTVAGASLIAAGAVLLATH